MERIKPNIQTAWETLRPLAYGYTPRRAKEGDGWNREQLRKIDLHWHDLRHHAEPRIMSSLSTRTAHTTGGRLPAGVHPASGGEVVARFGGTARRRHLLDRLHVALRHFAQAGCRTVYLAGSFVTVKRLPKDVDACWDVVGVNPDLVHPMFLDFDAGRTATLALFGAEFFRHR